MAEDNFVGCISCTRVEDLFDLFGPFGENYAKLLDSCFSIKVPKEAKFICKVCAEVLNMSGNLKEQIMSNMAAMISIKDEEYLDESILAEGEVVTTDPLAIASTNSYAAKENDKSEIDIKENDMKEEIKLVCEICYEKSDSPAELKEHQSSCHGMDLDVLEKKEFPCHFCNNSYSNRRACYTHLRMKHGLKLSNDHIPKHTRRERKKCQVCERDFSQKQILNKHLMKEHGIEVAKRKALDCPLCKERVSYGAYFSDHLLAEHDIEEEVEEIQFQTMDDFLMYKSTLQEETKYRFRKTTATKQTIEGLRSHYMCSQSGVYVYQGRGIRPAPERQIYKTGKACPAHMIVTEAIDCVKVIFHMTHVGHGACPYYEPRENKRMRLTPEEEVADCRLAWICDNCGMVFFEVHKYKQHIRTHNI